MEQEGGAFKVGRRFFFGAARKNPQGAHRRLIRKASRLPKFCADNRSLCQK
jgi:hypothetical protein